MNHLKLFVMNRLLLFFVGCFVSLTACKKASDPSAEPQKINTNLSYGSDPRNKLDIFLPANRDSTTPFVLLIHGGAWVSGNKEDMKAIQQRLLAKGIASASMSYRYVSSTVHYQQLMDDVQHALDFCQTKSAEWKIRHTKYIICGASAGAHMSLLYGYRYNTDSLVTGIMSAAGPTDLTDNNYVSYVTLGGLGDELEHLAGSPYTQPVDSNYVKVSPRLNIRNIPTLMIHGTSDAVVFYSQSQVLQSSLQTEGIANKLVTVQGANHDLNISNPATFDMIINEMVAWVMLYGK